MRSDERPDGDRSGAERSGAEWADDGESAGGVGSRPGPRTPPVVALVLLVAFGLSMLLCCLAAGRAFGLLDVDPAHLW